MIVKEQERLVCDICERTITNEHIYPKKLGFLWLHSLRANSWYSWRKQGYVHKYDVREFDFCGDCWEEIVETVKEKRGQ